MSRSKPYVDKDEELTEKEKRMVVIGLILLILGLFIALLFSDFVYVGLALFCIDICLALVFGSKGGVSKFDF